MCQSNTLHIVKACPLVGGFAVRKGFANPFETELKFWWGPPKWWGSACLIVNLPQVKSFTDPKRNGIKGLNPAEVGSLLQGLVAQYGWSH